jgi:hypothetical protein
MRKADHEMKRDGSEGMVRWFPSMIFCSRFSATKRNRMSVPGIGLMPGNFLAGEKTGNIFRPVRNREHFCGFRDSGTESGQWNGELRLSV